MSTQEELMIKRRIKLHMGAKNDPYILEIGSNDCSDTVQLLTIFSDAHIVCFEPDSSVFQKGMKNIQESIKNKKIVREPIMLNMAVGNTNGLIDFNFADNALSGSLKNPKLHLDYYPDVSFNKKDKVNCIRLDDFFVSEHIGIKIENKIIDLVHIDVQGAEDLVIEGGRKLFNDYVKFVYTEYSNVELYEGAKSLNQILEILGSDWELVEIMWNWQADGNALLRNKKLVKM